MSNIERDTASGTDACEFGEISKSLRPPGHPAWSKRCRSRPSPPAERLDRRPAVRLPCARSPAPLNFLPPASLRPLPCSGRPLPCVRSPARLASPRPAHRL